ncbi:MAG TPA: protoheme IX farnesyltransferase, partial [Leptospiraceae bacterium]|nr:protoheme IX farnesyltransferase [Leptospiraceae bacterium]
MKHWLLVWLKLIKPRVTSLVLVTALPGLYLGLENISGSLVFWTLFGTF